MAIIQAQTDHGKRKVMQSEVKKKKADIENFGNLSTAKKLAVFEVMLPGLIKLLEDGS